MPVKAPRYFTKKTQVSVAPGHHLGFDPGHGYYDAPGAPTIAKAAAPTGPVDPYSSIIGSLPRPETPAQIAQDAHGMISPLVAAVTGQIGTQVKNASNAIRGYAGDAASKLAAINFAAPYTGAEQGQAAVDAALRNALSGAGSADADQLAQRLAVINDPTVHTAADAVAGNGAANGNTQLAQGSAALGALIANGAASKNYGLQLPGIARLAGLQGITAAQQSGQNNIADQTRQLEAQLPSLIDSLTSRSDSRASAIAAAKQNQVARSDAIGATNAKNQTAVDVATIRAKTAREAADARKAQQDRAYALQFAKTYGYDPNTGQILPGFAQDASGHIVKTGTAKPTTKKLPTAEQANTLIQKWHDGAPTYVTKSVTNPSTHTSTSQKVKTGTTGQVTFMDAYKRLTGMGYDDVTARHMLDGYYKRGELGRAWLTNEEQQALRAASAKAGKGLNGPALLPKAHVNSGVGYLDRHQVAVLKAAGQLPPGHWINGSTDTQDLGPVYVIEP